MSDEKITHHNLGAEGITTLPAIVGQPTLQSFGLLPANHPFYILIGRVAAEWARLEHVLDEIIWNLSGIDKKLGSCITGQLSGQYNRFNAIQALAAARGFDKNTLDQIETISNRCSTLAKRRNRFVHDAWYSIGSNQVGQFKSYSIKDGVFGIDEVSYTYAEETIKLINDKVSEVGRLWVTLITSHPASP